MKKYLLIALAIVAVVVLAIACFPLVQNLRVKAHLANALAYQLAGNWSQTETELRKVIQLRSDNEEAWEKLAWNYCYNVSSDFDEVEDKYATIKRGIEIGIEGVAENPHSSRLQWDVGWNFFHKIGRAIEAEALRRLFAEDVEFQRRLSEHIDVDAALGPDGKPDSFLVAEGWFDKSARTADQFGRSEEIMKEVPFYSYSAHALTAFAGAIENEGSTDEAAARAWQMAEKAWNEYGDRTFKYAAGKTIRLNDRETVTAQREQLMQQKGSTQTGSDEVTKKTRELEEKFYWSDRFRAMMNFDYWSLRCRLEQTETMLTARRLMYEARQQAADANSSAEKREVARGLFEKAFTTWAEVLKHSETFREDDLTYEELAQFIGLYRSTVLSGQDLPVDFPLRYVVERVEKGRVEVEAAIEATRRVNRKIQGR